MSTQTGFAPLLQSTGEALNLSMQKLWLTGNVLAMGARLWVRHEFVSQETRPVEVIYSFALPRDASMRRFRMSGENFEVNSELRPTGEAHRLYEEGIHAGSLSALARHYGDGIINLSVGNIRPKEKVVVLLELVAGVELHDGSLRLRFPFTLAPSYHPQARAAEIAPGVLEMELPDEKFDDLVLPHFEKNAEHLHQVGFCLDVQMAGAIQEIASPSHALRVETIGPENSRVSLSHESALPDRDLVLDVRSNSSGASLFAGLDSAGKTRFAAVVPSTQLGQLHAGPRRLVILLDRSGSMQGTPIAQAKKAIEACLGALDEQDLFGVVAFSNSSQAFKPSLYRGSMDNRRDAQKFLQSIDAQGGTELAAGVEAAANLLQGEPGDILIITDGQVFGTETILARARATGVRMHCLGIGSASQDRFLAQLSSHTGGVSRFLTHNERVDLPAVELFASIGRPVAESVTAAVEGAPESRILPEPGHFVFSGTPLLVSGDLNSPAEARLKISWKGQQDKSNLELPIPPATCSPLGDTLKLLQGARIIADCESRILPAERRGVAARREASRANEQLLKLSQEYGLATSEMSLVAVVKRSGDIAGEIPMTQIVSIGLPAGMEMAQDLALPAMVGASAARTGSYDLSAIRGALMGPPQAAPQSTPISSLKNWVHKRLERAAATTPPLQSSAPVLSTDDVLVALAGMLEPDGGMPGKTPEIRIAHSLAALLCFASQANSSSNGPFRVHVAKLLNYLSPALLQQLDSATAQDASRTLEKVTSGKSLSGDWLHHARKLIEDRGMEPDLFWRHVAEAIRAL